MNSWAHALISGCKPILGDNMHQFNPTILRAYDIRGEVGTSLHTEDAYAIGRTFSQLILEQPAEESRDTPYKVAVGRDGRLTSPELAAACIAGICDGGCDVIDIGVGPTPMLYFADRFFNCDAAIQITGSHNPKQFNGFKMVQNHASFFGEDIQRLGRSAAAGWDTSPTPGIHHTKDILDDYVQQLVKSADASGLRIVWDCGNGAAGPATEALVAQLAGEHKTLYTDIDGHFPNHHPNPVDPETLEALRHEVALFNADCGIGFDGDGDRIGVIDAKGRQIAGDFLTAYLGLDILQRKPGSQIIFDVKSSAAAMQLIEEAGGRTELWKTGHSHMKKRLKETKAPLAGEMSGHIFIQDGYYGFDDALYVASRLTALMAEKKAETGQTITDFMDQLAEQYVSPECRIDCPDDEKFQAMEKMADAFQAEFDDSQLNFIDGVRLTTSTGWCLIRPSNTEGALIARAEASSQEAYDALIEILKRHLSAVNISWDGP